MFGMSRLPQTLFGTTVIFYGAAFMFQLRLDPVSAGMFIISINTGAYMAEIVRGIINWLPTAGMMLRIACGKTT